MQQNMKQAKQKERMQDKLKRNKEKKEANDLGVISNVDETTFVWNDSNSNSKEPLKKSAPKRNKKKNKGKKKKN